MSLPDLTLVSPVARSRSISFENQTGARGAGEKAHAGRKGAPSRTIGPGERVILAEIEGPGVVRHLWMTFPPGPPEVMRSKFIEIFYDGSDEPSVSAPAVDFFGIPWGRPVPLDTALMTISEGRGFNCWMAMPFRQSIRIEFVNHGRRPAPLYFQVDYTLHDELPEGTGYLHVTYRRQNPTIMKEDFVIADGLVGPGRFLGCVVGIRVLDRGNWYGEGEVKIYLDGDEEYPTICGTGLEDYALSAWGMGTHQTRYAGSPLVVQDPESGDDPDVVLPVNPDFASFYRWHVLDPIMFERDLKVTIQQIGLEFWRAGQETDVASRTVAGAGWWPNSDPRFAAMGIAERVDDYCATAYVMCQRPQPVLRATPDAALSDIERLPYERPHPLEASFTQSD